MDQRHILTMIGKVQRLFHRRIAAANDHDLLAPIEKPIACCACGYALALHGHFTVQSQPAGLRARRDHQRVGNEHIAAIARQGEGALG